jgi:predicted DNA-binding transcriptional regulator AlpA
MQRIHAVMQAQRIEPDEKPAIHKRALSISEFCAENGIGRTTFYKIVGTKEGPRIMKVGKRVLVTIECAEEWRRSRLQPLHGAA